MASFKLRRVGAGLLVAAVLAGCAAREGDEPRTVGRATAIGVVAGVATGAVLGNVLAASGRAAAGTAIGAAIGGALGGGAGLAMDRQRGSFERQLADERARNDVVVEQLRQDVLLLTLANDIQFATSSAEVKPGLRTTLAKIANVVRQNPGTQIVVIGHTDSSGPREYNQRLSERRAEAVRAELISQGVNPMQLAALGRGPEEPRADNATPEGRAANRRVELVIVQPA